MTDFQTRKLTRYFQIHDIDDDGAIEASDFDRNIENVRVLRGEDGNGHSQLSGAYRELWLRISNAADGDKDGSVDLDEWLAYWQITLEDDGRYQDEVLGLTNRLFTVFDLDKDDTNEDGAITRNKLLEASSSGTMT